MAFAFYLTHDFNNQLLQAIKTTDNTNHLFKYQCIASAMTIPSTDDGQIWVTEKSPELSANGTTLYNPKSEGFLGITGEKNSNAVNPGIEAGAITFLPEEVVNPLKFVPVQNEPGKFYVSIFENGANTNKLLAFNVDDESVSFTYLDLTSVLPINFYIKWRLTQSQFQ